MIKVNPANKNLPMLTYQKRKKCSYCGREHEIKREKCLAFGKILANCLKKELFSSSMQIQKEKR